LLKGLYAFKTKNNNIYNFRNIFKRRFYSKENKMNLLRVQEKEELQNLNERLVNYIHTVRQLELDNKLFESIHLDSQKQICEIKNLYDKELRDVKENAEKFSKELTKAIIERDRYKSENEEFSVKLVNSVQKAKFWEDKAHEGEAKVIEFKSRYEAIFTEKEYINLELNKSRNSRTEIEKKLEAMKTKLDKESQARRESENTIGTLNGTLAFKTNLLETEINILKNNRRVEIEQTQVKDDQEVRSAFNLNCLREEAAKDYQAMKSDLEKRYKSKMSRS
jgi:lamin B